MAIVVASGTEHGRKYIGSIVKVLHAAPPYRFQQPDGMWHVGCEAGFWLLESTTGIPFDVKAGYLMVRTMFATGADWNLRPISGIPVHDEQLDEVPA